MSAILIDADHAQGSSQAPRPEQGGRRITRDFLQELGSRECPWRFRFTADELVELAEVLRLPPILVTHHRYNVPRIEALALTCARLARPGDIYDLVRDYDRSASAISEIINETVCLIDATWAHLLDFDHNHLLSPHNLSNYAAAIRRAGAPMSTIWGFIDCTLRRIARPTWFQRPAYS
ncbi:hypothetical protein BD309DRAFT_878037, partial [Dichomitus squalens]